MTKSAAARKRQRARKQSAPVKPAPVLQGQGPFLADLWKRGRRYIPRAIGGVIGGFAGNPQLGYNMGAAFSKRVLGWGQYGVAAPGGEYFDPGTSPWRVSANSLLTSKGQVPTMHNVGGSGFRVIHKEYIGPVYSSTTPTGFSDTVYPLNPGMVVTFPWLSAIASNFQQYRIMGAVLVYKPMLPDGIATFGSIGQVIIAAQMNPAAANFNNQLEMEQCQYVTAGKPTLPLVAPIECSPTEGIQNSYLVRSGAVPAGSVIQSFDHAKVEVATVGQGTSGVLMGNLYISYDIMLLNPIYGLGRVILGCEYNLTGASNTNPLGTIASKIFDTIGITVGNNTGTGTNTITLPTGSDGKYYFTIIYTSTSVAQTCPTYTLTNATLLGLNWASPPATTACTNQMSAIAFAVVNPAIPAVISLSGLLTGTVGANNATFMMTDMPSATP